MRLTNKQATALGLRILADAPPHPGATITHHETVPGLDEPSWDKLRTAIFDAVLQAHPDPEQASSDYDDEHDVDSQALIAKAAIPRK